MAFNACGAPGEKLLSDAYQHQFRKNGEDHVWKTGFGVVYMLAQVSSASHLLLSQYVWVTFHLRSA